MSSLSSVGCGLMSVADSVDTLSVLSDSDDDIMVEDLVVEVVVTRYCVDDCVDRLSDVVVGFVPMSGSGILCVVGLGIGSVTGLVISSMIISVPASGSGIRSVVVLGFGSVLGVQEMGLTSGSVEAV